MQDWQLDTFGRMVHVPEREAEGPRHAPDALLDGHQRRRAEGELLTAQAEAAGASRLDVAVSVRLTPEVQADDHCVPGAEGTRRGVAQSARLAPQVFRSANAAWPAR